MHNESGCNVSIRLSVRGDRGGERASGGVGSASGGFAVMRVADDGAGISREGLAALEARLARSRTARSAAGCAAGAFDSSAASEHGLGLVLVDRIARAHGGALALEGAPGEGFAVEIALPLA